MTLCKAPWVHVCQTAKGDFKPCCHFRGTTGAASFEEHWNSEEMRLLRLNMLETGYESLPGCINCSKHGTHHPKAEYYDSMLDREVIERETSSTGRYTGNPTCADLREITCNYTCRICDADSSSSIAAEQGRVHVVSETNWLTDEVLEGLTHIVWAGGEPFLSRSFYSVMTRLITLGNTQLEVRFNSNLSFPGNSFHHAMEILSRFNPTKVLINASVDGVGDVGSYLRPGFNDYNFFTVLALLRDRGFEVKADICLTNIGLVYANEVVTMCQNVDVPFVFKAMHTHRLNYYLDVNTLQYDAFIESFVDMRKAIKKNLYMDFSRTRKQLGYFDTAYQNILRQRETCFYTPAAESLRKKVDCLRGASALANVFFSDDRLLRRKEK